MTPNDDLYRLVMALTRNERQAFTKAATSARNEAPIYLELFHLLCKLDTYDEVAFLASKPGQAFKQNYPVRKKELYEKILQVLRAQRQSSGAEKPIDFQVREQLEDARILREKRLFDLSRKRLQQARTEAEKYQLHEALLEILRLERYLTIDKQDPGYERRVNELHAEIEETIEVIQNKYRMLYLRDQVFLPTRQHATLGNPIDFESLEKVMASDELTNVALARSFEAISNYHFCHANYHHLLGNPRRAWVHFRSIYLRWQEQKGVQRVRPVEYRNMLQNYLAYSNDAARYEDFEPALEQLLRGPFQSEEERVTAIQNALYVRLQKHLNLCEWVQAREVYQEFKQNLPTTGERLTPSRMMTFYLSFSRLFMVENEWKHCRDWARRVIEEGVPHQLEGLVRQAWLQEAIAMHELGDTERLETRLRAAKRSLGNTSASEFERKFMRTLLTLAGIERSAQQERSWERLHEEVRLRHSQGVAAYQIVEVWLLSKVEKRSMAAILLERREAEIAAAEAEGY